MITIGRIAEKYGMLPSMVAEHATTYDLMITDVLATFDNYQQQKSSGKLMDASIYGYTTEELMKLKDLGKSG